MNSIDIKEKKLLQEWAAANNDERVFEQRNSTGTDSYFITRSSEDTYIMPYKFETIQQLQEKIDEVCGAEIDVQRQKLLSVAAFKCRTMPTEDLGEKQKEKSMGRGKLPEFTYAF